MNKKQKFLFCKKCGNVAVLVVDSGVTPVCCGEEMSVLVPNTVDASLEKHVPVAKIDGEILNVQVGAELHPMTAEHHIAFVYVATEKGGQRVDFEIGADPIANFKFIDDMPVTVYAYCNLHGLWAKELPAKQ
jgi:superoxide reductase